MGRKGRKGLGIWVGGKRQGLGWVCGNWAGSSALDAYICHKLRTGFLTPGGDRFILFPTLG